MGPTYHLVDPGGLPVVVVTPTNEVHQIIIYIHGYNIDHLNLPPGGSYADLIYRDHHLDVQFYHAADTGCLVIIPESPKSKDAMVYWTTSQQLLTHIRQHAPDLVLGPDAIPITMIGHSGAYRTMYHWISDKRVNHMALIDGLYGFAKDFQSWLESPRPPVARKLTLVVGQAGPPRQNSEMLVARTRSKLRIREATPSPLSPDLSMNELETPLLYWRTELGHMELVKSGKIIPQIVRRIA